MSRQLGSLHRSNSHPANLQTQIPIISLFAFPPSDFLIINISSSTNSDNNSDISVLYSISQFNNSNAETPDEFSDSEPSPSNYTQTNSSVFFKTPFSTNPIKSSTPIRFHSFLCFPSDPNLFSTSFRQIIQKFPRYPPNFPGAR